MPRFLHIDCGNNNKSHTTRYFAQDTWEEVRMDASEANNPNIVGSIDNMGHVESSSFDAVFASHVLERLYPHQVVPALKEVLRVLNNDGYFLITSADLQAACALIAEDKLLEPAYQAPAGNIAPIDILYGFRPAIAAGHVQFARNCGFTAKALIGTLAQTGFGSIWSARNPKTFTVAAIATKAERSEAMLRELAQQHFGQ